MTTFVLGWDGLDYDLVSEFGLADSFGPHTEKIDTICNPVFGKPHTRELWPTLISGEHPSTHGFRVQSEEESLDWQNPIIDTVSAIANQVVPHTVRLSIGRRLRNAGADLSDTTPQEYRDRGVETIFDGRESSVFALPNYKTPESERLGLTTSRKSTFREFIRVSNDGIEKRHDTDLRELEYRLWSAATEKLGATEVAAHRDHDIVWTWFGYLDTVGHIAPAVNQPGFQERAYRQAAKWTREIQNTTTEDDTLVCLSDHGLQSGEHTESAFIGSDSEDIVDIDSVTGVFRVLDEETPENDNTASIRDNYKFDAQDISGSNIKDTKDVKENLEDLGYI